MHTIDACSQLSPRTHVMLNPFKKDKSKTSSCPTKKLGLRPDLKINISSSRKSSFFEILRESSQTGKISFENSKSQAEQSLSLIEDPLWKSICNEMTDLMGSPPVEKVLDSKLGTFCSEGKSIDLCCPTDEAAQFVDQYSFLILGSLQRYFPAVKTLKTKVEYAGLEARQ
ncbi:MAG: hypothetical protein K2X28_06105 [Alphaproteobacteria bacterium]|nr:hypothetical protein [Alphaproteobacteria bacterium]